MARVEIAEVVLAPPYGAPVQGASVEVRVRSSQSLATVYAGETGTPTLSNPLTTDAYGRIEGWVDEATYYDLVVSGSGITSYTQPFLAPPTTDASAAVDAHAAEASHTNARTPTAHKSSHALGGSDPLRPAEIGEFNDLRRSSEVSTLPRMAINSLTARGTGVLSAHPAWVRSAGAYTQVRCVVGAPGTTSDVRMGVWADDGSKLAETGNFAASLASNTLLSVPLLASLSLSVGQKVWLGLANVHTAIPSFAVWTFGSIYAAPAQLEPALTRGTFGWTGGALPTLGAATPGPVFWLELLP
jgi:hypothetical protein